MNPLSPWVALTEISLLLIGCFFLGLAISFLRARPGIRRIQSNIREAKRDVPATHTPSLIVETDKFITQKQTRL